MENELIIKIKEKVNIEVVKILELEETIDKDYSILKIKSICLFNNSYVLLEAKAKYYYDNEEVELLSIDVSYE